MKFQKGMKFLCLADNTGCRTKGKIYVISENNSDYINYIGDNGQKCLVGRLDQVQLLNNLPKTEIEWLDKIYLNFK